MAEIPELTRDEDGMPSFAGYTFAFFGKFAFWPAYHLKTPRQLAKFLGATVVSEVDGFVDFVVLGDRRGKGRAEARKKAEMLARRAAKAAKKGQELQAPVILNESEYREMSRRDITGKSFTFFGEFEYCPPDFEEGLPPSLTESAGGVVQEKVDEHLDYLVLGNRRGKGKTAAERKARELMQAGSKLRILDEEHFLDLVRTEKTEVGELDFPAFLGQLRGVVDTKKLARALKMLKEERFQLFVELDDERLVGVVRSQTGYSSHYSPWLNSEGEYGCITSDLYRCMGLQGKPCKHLLVLLVGLARTEALDPAVAFEWISRSAGRRPKEDEDLAADTFLRYKSAEAGEIDWRPLETVPEDYYAF